MVEDDYEIWERMISSPVYGKIVNELAKHEDTQLGKPAVVHGIYKSPDGEATLFLIYQSEEERSHTLYRHDQCTVV